MPLPDDTIELSSEMPFMLEDALREHGATFTKATEPWGEHVAGQNTRLLTGQNPNSSTGVATAMLEMLNANAK